MKLYRSSGADIKEKFREQKVRGKAGNPPQKLIVFPFGASPVLVVTE